MRTRRFWKQLEQLRFANGSVVRWFGSSVVGTLNKLNTPNTLYPLAALAAHGRGNVPVAFEESTIEGAGELARASTTSCFTLFKLFDLSAEE